jgi:hypothetical protein
MSPHWYFVDVLVCDHRHRLEADVRHWRRTRLARRVRRPSRR